MKVHLIKKSTIIDFITHNPNSRTSLCTWLSRIKYADWNIPEDMLKTFNTADLLGNGTQRVVFDLSGNKYRMICKYNLVPNKCIYIYGGLALMRIILIC